MATVYGVNRTKFNDPYPANIVDGAVSGGVVKYFYDEYEASSLAADDVIQFGPKLPAGAVILDITVDFDDLGTGTTLDIGDSHTVDRYLDGVDTATAAGKSSIRTSTATIGDINAVGYVIGTNSGDDQLQAKNLGSTATGTIKFGVVYAVRG